MPGVLIGTVKEAGSATGLAPNDWTTQPQVGGATSASDSTGSLITLLSGNNQFTSHATTRS